jgi:hypothetical protein
MTMLMGNTESRVVYKNIQLNNLNNDKPDYSHDLYVKYLRNNFFLPANEKKYFLHLMNNTIASDQTLNSGLMNIFPVELSSDEFNKPPISLGRRYNYLCNRKIF